ncbi:MAG: hypothetical protein ACRDFX_14080, partial [Chloroflexota bacterium]
SGPLNIYEHVLPLSKAPEGIQGTPEDYITTRIDVESWREQLLSALAAHRSQVPHETIHMFRGFPVPWIDHFVCVRTTVPILIPEDDLFAGIDR